MNQDNSQTDAASGSRRARPEALSVARRRFAKGLAPAVLGTLASKPVLGAQYICTVSGHTSGNMSARPDDGVSCAVGKSPSYWLANLAWPAAFTRGTLLVKSTSPDRCEYLLPGKGTSFNGYTTTGGRKLSDQFWTRNPENNCLVRDTPNNSNSRPAASMLDVLNSNVPDPNNNFRLGKATIASLLNAAALNSTYPISADRIVEMFNAVRAGGSYRVAGANLDLTKLGVILYFEKLYNPA